MKISVFGNETDPNDNIALKLVPWLRQRLPKMNFLMQDPTESIEPLGDPWIILDTAIGIDQVQLIESLDDLELVKGSSVHDFDVYLDLRLRAKIEQLPKLKIILIPHGDDLLHVCDEVVKILSSF